MKQQWSNNGAYYGATREHTIEQQWGIPWSSNRAYHGAMMGLGIPWSSNGAYHGAAMGHTMEQ